MKNRIEYIDSIRGFCMFLVVFWHLSFTWGVQQTSFNYFFLQVRMPLFFFISGFFAYKEKYSLDIIKEKIQIRFFKQLIPTIVVGCLYCFLNSVPLLDALKQDNKYGYWFTIVAFEIFLLYCPLILLTSKCKENWRSYLIVLYIVVFGICSAFSHALDGFVLWKIISGFKIAKFLPFFFAGTLARKENSIFSKIITNHYAVSLCFVLYIFFYFYSCKIGNAVQGYCGILAIFAIFSHYKDTFESKTIIGKYLSLVGKRTLPIYLTHYFIISGFSSLEIIAKQVTESNFSGALFISIFAILVLLICILIEQIIKVTPPLYTILFGPLEKRTR